jgi:hypothetical protein
MIASQPVNTTVKAGKAAKFRIIARGTAPLHYQWKKNGSNITGASKAAYTTPPATVGDNRSLFSVDFTNSISTVTNNDATLTLN